MGANFRPDQVGAYRSGLDTDGARLSDALAWLVRHRGAEVIGSALERVPAPYPPDHPHADLLRFKRLHVRWEIDPGATLGSRKLVTVAANQLTRAGEIHRWLVDHLN